MNDEAVYRTAPSTPGLLKKALHRTIAQMGKIYFSKCYTIHWIQFLDWRFIRETVPSQTSDMGKKTVSVLAHSFWLPKRANLVYILSRTPLRCSRS